MKRRKYGTCKRNDALVRELAAAGWSCSAIGRKIGTAHRHVSRYLLQNSIPRLHNQSGERNPAWRGGRMTDKSGYILLLRPEHHAANRHGYVREHRAVMEAVLGRPLLRSEVVHHIDGNRGNNAPSNLQLFASNGAHLAHELKGRVPRWTADGLGRMRQANRRRKGHHTSASQKASSPDGRPSRRKTVPSEA